MTTIYHHKRLHLMTRDDYKLMVDSYNSWEGMATPWPYSRVRLLKTGDLDNEWVACLTKKVSNQLDEGTFLGDHDLPEMLPTPLTIALQTTPNEFTFGDLTSLDFDFPKVSDAQEYGVVMDMEGESINVVYGKLQKHLKIADKLLDGLDKQDPPSED